MYSIDDFRNLNQHSRKRFSERGIYATDICAAIDTGEIIEQYTDDFPFPSCLILGKINSKIIHVVASI